MLSGRRTKRGLPKNLDNNYTLHNDLSIPLMDSQQSIASEDPFHVYKEELELKISNAKTRFRQWNDLLSSTNTSKSDEFKKLTNEIMADLRSADSSLSILGKTVQMVESNRLRFKHINEEELVSRKAVVRGLQQEVTSIREEMKSDKVQSKLNRDAREAKESLVVNSEAAKKVREVNTNFIQDEQQKQQIVIKQQDEGLDMLYQDVKKIGGMAKEIHIEVNTQNTMLDEMSEDVDETAERMGFVMKNLGKMLKTRDRCQLSGILILSLVLLILIFLVIYT